METRVSGVVVEKVLEKIIVLPNLFYQSTLGSTAPLRDGQPREDGQVSD